MAGGFYFGDRLRESGVWNRELDHSLASDYFDVDGTTCGAELVEQVSSLWQVGGQNERGRIIPHNLDRKFRAGDPDRRRITRSDSEVPSWRHGDSESWRGISIGGTSEHQTGRLVVGRTQDPSRSHTGKAIFYSGLPTGCVSLTRPEADHCGGDRREVIRTNSPLIPAVGDR